MALESGTWHLHLLGRMHGDSPDQDHQDRPQAEPDEDRARAPTVFTAQPFVQGPQRHGQHQNPEVIHIDLEKALGTEIEAQCQAQTQQGGRRDQTGDHQPADEKGQAAISIVATQLEGTGTSRLASGHLGIRQESRRIQDQGETESRYHTVRGDRQHDIGAGFDQQTEADTQAQSQRVTETQDTTEADVAGLCFFCHGLGQCAARSATG